ncbi:MAG: transposase [Candidatus Yanofskybacteria bacterium]|nr:transposase [Candidatus Yanofskybacteria bacterium]
MEKYLIRRQFIKLRIKGKTNKECEKIIREKYSVNFDRRTLRRWWKRFSGSDEWDLRDFSQKPAKLPIKFSEEEKEVVEKVRKNFGYGPKKIRIQAQRIGIDMSISTVKRIIKQTGLSKGSKMEGVKLKWVRFERPNPNDMWQIDGDENDDGTWRVPVVDDCSRYCLGVYNIKDNTTEAMIIILESLIAIHGKPKQILTDNGSEFGGSKDWDSDFDKWCEKMEIIHIRSGVHKPTTVGKVSAVQRTIQAELPHWKGDLELWRMMYNHERPHESLRGLTPADVYFQFKRHKKHYEL